MTRDIEQGEGVPVMRGLSESIKRVALVIENRKSLKDVTAMETRNQQAYYCG